MPKGKKVSPLDNEYSMSKLLEIFKKEIRIPRTRLIDRGWGNHGLNYKIQKLIDTKRITKRLNPNDTRKVFYILLVP